jgi:Family of unknown function (DUF6152)
MTAFARCLWTALLCVPAAAVAHHSFAKFDRQQVVEIEGNVVAVHWQNPHVHFIVRGRGADGPVQDWDLETNSPGVLRRLEIGSDIVRVGDHVRVAGNPAVDAGPEMFASNLMLPDGRELQLGSGVALRFAEVGVGNLNGWRVTEGDKSRPELGLFRVWSSTAASAPTLFPNRQYPLTEAARRAVDAFDRVAESERMAGSCTPKGMPWMMEQPYDLAFEQDGADILLKLEEYDIVRHIHMDWEGDRAALPYTPDGFSTGEWQAGTLVVTTTNLNSPNFKWEIPQSEAARIVERFTPSALGDRLDYEIVVTDPETFTEPVRITKYWLSIPGQVLDAYDCVSDP